METMQTYYEGAKKNWVTPELIVHGDVEEITKEAPGIHGHPRGYPEGS